MARKLESYLQEYSKLSYEDRLTLIRSIRIKRNEIKPPSERVAKKKTETKSKKAIELFSLLSVVEQQKLIEELENATD